MRLVFILIVCCAFIAFTSAGAQTQNTVNGGSFALRSSGSPSGDDWVLNANGYVGTYITLDAPGSVTLNIIASGATDDVTSPRMNIVVNDSVAGWEVAGGFNNYSTTLNLQAAAHFVRIVNSHFNALVPSRADFDCVYGINHGEHGEHGVKKMEDYCSPSSSP